MWFSGSANLTLIFMLSLGLNLVQCLENNVAKEQPMVLFLFTLASYPIKLQSIALYVMMR